MITFPAHALYDFTHPTLDTLPEHDAGEAWEELEQPPFIPVSYTPESEQDFPVDEWVCAICGAPVGFYLYLDYEGVYERQGWSTPFRLITDDPAYVDTFLCEDHVPANESTP